MQVVLVNGGTASSAELVAASLHDNHRATLLGEKTFGKGRTQRIVRLRDGGLLLLSNTLYLTPEHQSVDKVESHVHPLLRQRVFVFIITLYSVLLCF